MISEAEQEVGKIVVVIPAAVSVFEQYGIRFYDSAPQTLEVACRQAGTPLDIVLEALKVASREKDGKHGRWDQVPLVALIRYVLENHHEWERLQVEKIQNQIDLAVPPGASDHKKWLSLRSLFETMTKKITSHLRKEERQLFPSFLHEVSPGAAQAVRSAVARRLVPLTFILEKEHDELLIDWEEMGKMMNGFRPADDASKEQHDVLSSLTGFERYQHQHIHKENFILFEKIRSLVHE